MKYMKQNELTNNVKICIINVLSALSQGMRWNS